MRIPRSKFFETFVIETNTAALIDSDTRDWQKKSDQMKQQPAKKPAPNKTGAW